MELPEVVGHTYESGSQVGLDGIAYRNCTFKAGCRIIYRGAATRVEACKVEAGCVWDFQENAAFVVTVLSDLGFRLIPPDGLSVS
jgi:hypothetical protein